MRIVSGDASEWAAALQGQGFTNVTPANPDATTVLPAQTVVYYQNEADLATALSSADEEDEPCEVCAVVCVCSERRLNMFAASPLCSVRNGCAGVYWLHV